MLRLALLDSAETRADDSWKLDLIRSADGSAGANGKTRQHWFGQWVPLSWGGQVVYIDATSVNSVFSHDLERWLKSYRCDWIYNTTTSALSMTRLHLWLIFILISGRIRHSYCNVVFPHAITWWTQHERPVVPRSLKLPTNQWNVGQM